MIVDRVVDMVTTELKIAQGKFSSFKSGHEGYAILLEEVDELWHEIKHGNSTSARREAIQVAAMAIRFVVDLYNEEGKSR